MRRFACVLALAALCLGLPAAQSRAGNGWQAAAAGMEAVARRRLARRHPRRRSARRRPRLGLGRLGLGTGLGLGPGWGYGYGPGWYAPAYAYPAYPPAVVQQPPPQYIEQLGPRRATATGTTARARVTTTRAFRPARSRG